MFIVPTYGVAVALCFVTMLCWGSWGNTQKLAAKSWRYELFYWDYVIGMVLFALLLAFTLGSIGSEGRSFLPDLAQASASSILWILVGGIIFNASNILLSASISLAGMSVAFPLGVGIALVMGVVNNYRVAVAQGAKTGNVTLLVLGVILVVCAIVANGVASGRKGDGDVAKADQKKGIVLALIAGLVMSFFSSFVMRAMDTTNFVTPEAGKVTPYTAIVIWWACWAAPSGAWVRLSAISPLKKPVLPFPMPWVRVHRSWRPCGACSSGKNSRVPRRVPASFWLRCLSSFS